MNEAQLTVVQRAVALVDLNVPQLADACRMLDQCQERYDKLSGICATMRGFVLLEAKRKLAHGKFLPWLAENFKKSKKTAAQDMRVAGECGKSNPKVTFETLGLDLASTIKELEAAQIDLKHPLVREIAGWVDGRTRYQLLLDYPSAGYDRTTRGKGLTGPTSEPIDDQARKFLIPAAQKFVNLWFRGIWIGIPRQELLKIDGDLLDIRRQIKKHLYGEEGE